MDMNTIEAVVPTANPGEFRDGDAWLAGGTVLFSYGSSTLRRLLDITGAGWEAITVTEHGIELAASCTVAQLYALPERDNLPSWPALELIRPACDSFVASFKIWNVSTVGGNIATSLPAGPMTSLCASLDGVATILMPSGGSRQVAVADLVTGDGRNSLAPGELIRSIFLPSKALACTVAFRRLSLSNLGRSGVLVIGRRDSTELVITVTASTIKPIQLRFNDPFLDAHALQMALEQIPADDFHADIHGHPVWRRDMTYRLAEEIRAELVAVELGTAESGAAELQSPEGA